MPLFLIFFGAAKATFNAFAEASAAAVWEAEIDAAWLDRSAALELEKAASRDVSGGKEYVEVGKSDNLELSSLAFECKLVIHPAPPAVDVLVGGNMTVGLLVCGGITLGTEVSGDGKDVLTETDIDPPVVVGRLKVNCANHALSVEAIAGSL